MGNFENLKIKEKLIKGFSSVSVIASMATIFAIFAMIIVTIKSYTLLLNYGFAQTSIAQSIASLHDQNQILDALHTDPFTDSKEKLKKLNDEYLKQTASLQKTLRYSEEKAIYSDITEKIDALSELIQECIITDSSTQFAKDPAELTDQIHLLTNDIITQYTALAHFKTSKGNSLFVIMYIINVVNIILVIAILLLTRRVAYGFVIKLTNTIVNPLYDCIKRLELLAEGDFTSPVPVPNTQDELQNISISLSHCTKRISQAIHELNDNLAKMAKGDFQISFAADFPGELKHIQSSLGSFTQEISQTMLRIRNTSHEVANTSQQLSDSAQSISQGAADQASSIEELQATMTDISEEVEKNAKHAQSANFSAKTVDNHIVETNTQMQQLVEAMQLISDTSSRISLIINSINDIASQTNLLALNASIEAARAGEMGKGFAVVANQVGNLAYQSAQAAKNTAELISSSLKAVEKGRQLVSQTAAQLTQSANHTRILVSNIDEISIASTRQAEALSEISQAIEQIAGVVEINTALSEESSAHSEAMCKEAQLLDQQISAFKLAQVS